jgi:hypothetical protein
MEILRIFLVQQRHVRIFVCHGQHYAVNQVTVTAARMARGGLHEQSDIFGSMFRPVSSKTMHAL